MAKQLTIPDPDYAAIMKQIREIYAKLNELVQEVKRLAARKEGRDEA